MWSHYSFCSSSIENSQDFQDFPIVERYEPTYTPIERYAPRYGPVERICSEATTQALRRDRHLGLGLTYPKACLGPWTHVGYVVSEDATDARDKSMRLYCRRAQMASGRYDYKVIDTNNVDIIFVKESAWLETAASVTIPGRTYVYTVTLDQPYA